MTIFASCFGVFLVFAFLQAASAEQQAPAVAPQALPGVTTPESKAVSDPTALKPGMNQFIGTVQTVDTDSRVLRMTVDGGYSAELTFSNKTVCLEGGKPLPIDELDYNDRIVVRYVGRELIAAEIERLVKNVRFAPAPDAPAANPPPPPPTETPSPAASSSETSSETPAVP